MASKKHMQSGWLGWKEHHNDPRLRCEQIVQLLLINENRIDVVSLATSLLTRSFIKKNNSLFLVEDETDCFGVLIGRLSGLAEIPEVM